MDAEVFKITVRHMGDSALLINETVTFIEKYVENYTVHILSGSDGTELMAICRTLEIASYFTTITGFPNLKKQLSQNIFHDWEHDPITCLLIGNSIDDHEAAYTNGITFMAYNNSSLDHLSDFYLNLSPKLEKE